MSKNGQSYREIVSRQFKKNTPAVISAYIILGIFFLALFADILSNDKLSHDLHLHKQTLVPFYNLTFVICLAQVLVG